MVLRVHEADLHLDPSIGPDRMSPGIHREVVTPRANEKRIERLWLDLRANGTRNHRCRTIER